MPRESCASLVPCLAFFKCLLAFFKGCADPPTEIPVITMPNVIIDIIVEVTGKYLLLYS